MRADTSENAPRDAPGDAPGDAIEEASGAIGTARGTARGGGRELILELPAPLSFNNLIRTSYHRRNQRREATKRHVIREMERLLGRDWRKKWPPMGRVRVDAIIYVERFLDHMELPATLKIEMDALQEVGVIRSDGPKWLERGDIVQRAGRRRLRLRLTELDRNVRQPELDF